MRVFIVGPNDVGHHEYIWFIDESGAPHAFDVRLQFVDDSAFTVAELEAHFTEV